MKIASIPTTYKGVNFRSRLEARWAAFFDLEGWDWEYEPVDLKGWIPDFIIKGKQDLFVEIKWFPVYEEYPHVSDKWIEQIKKIEKARPNIPVLFLSSNPYQSGNTHPVVGFLLNELEDGFDYSDQYEFKCEDLLYDIVLAGGFPNFLTHEPALELIEPLFTTTNKLEAWIVTKDEQYLRDQWNVAGNQTQWKKQ